MKTISRSSVSIEASAQADTIRAEETGAFQAAMRSEIDAAMAAWGDELSKHYWGDTPPAVTARYVPTVRERIRWRWSSIRQAVARAALWMLRVDARDLCDCDY